MTRKELKLLELGGYDLHVEDGYNNLFSMPVFCAGIRKLGWEVHGVISCTSEGTREVLFSTSRNTYLAVVDSLIGVGYESSQWLELTKVA